MRTTANWQLAAGLIVVAGFAGQAQSAKAGSPAANLNFTIHVHNYAGVDSKTMTDAEKAASAIFQKAGVRSQWVDTPVTPEALRQIAGDAPVFGLSHLQMYILPRAMAERLGLPGNVAGVAPGTGLDRLKAYVFYNRVEDLANTQTQAQLKNTISRHATTDQILGEVIAHEIGHILLNLDVHTERGIMRGSWDLSDLRDIAEGCLTFSKQQAAVIQAEVARRIRQQNASSSVVLAEVLLPTAP